MVYVTLYSFLETYLAVRKAIVANEKIISNAMKYDKPCCQKQSEQNKGLFILWCLENINCYGDQIDKMISVANRWAKNCGDCSVSESEINAFLETDLGNSLAYTSELSGFIMTNDDTWLLQQNGYKLIL